MTEDTFNTICSNIGRLEENLSELYILRNHYAKLLDQTIILPETIQINFGGELYIIRSSHKLEQLKEFCKNVKRDPEMTITEYLDKIKENNSGFNWTIQQEILNIE